MDEGFTRGCSCRWRVLKALFCARRRSSRACRHRPALPGRGRSSPWLRPYALAPYLALHADAAAVRLDQLLDQVEPQARAAEASRGAHVHLRAGMDEGQRRGQWSWVQPTPQGNKSMHTEQRCALLQTELQPPCPPTHPSGPQQAGPPTPPRTCSKASKILSILSGGMPTPVSETVMYTLPSTTPALTDTVPARVNLVAFPTKLYRICMCGGWVGAHGRQSESS